MPTVRTARLTFRPLTPERWPDLEALFGPRGACAGCWCMWWRLPRGDFRERQGEPNRRALRRYVVGGAVPGLLAYAGAQPVGWVAVEPRAAYPSLQRSRTLSPVDAAPVWAITCFFVARPWRGHGLVARLVEAAVAHARRAGAPAVEAYPVDVHAARDDASLYTGTAGTFRGLGFDEVARRSPSRPVMRLALPSRRRASPQRRARASSRASTSAKRGSRSR